MSTRVLAGDRMRKGVEVRNVADTLRQFTMFSDLDPGELDAVAQITRMQEFGPGDQLFVEGEPADDLYLLTRGKAVVKVRSPEGRQALIDQLGAGELLGWSAWVEPHVSVASAWTTEPSEVLIVPAAKLRHLCETDQHMGYEIAKGMGQVISRRFGQAIGRYGDVLDKDLRAFGGKEKVVWESGELQLTTEAVLIGMEGASPDVIPLEALLDVEVEGDVVIFHAHGGDDFSPPLEDPERLAALVRDEMLRTRYAHRRRD